MELRAGTRLSSAVCDAEIVVVRAPTGSVDIECGGRSMVPHDSPTAGGEIHPARMGPTLIGKRYVDADLGLEVLCTRGGEGALSVDGRLLALAEAKPLPSSD